MPLEGLYRDVVEGSSDGIWAFDLDGRTLYVNAALAAMFGVTRDEFLEYTVFDTLDEVGREQFSSHLDVLRAGRFNESDVECRFVRRDGSSMWVLVSERGLYDAAGQLTGVLHRLSDYTDRRQTVDQLAASRRALGEAQRIARLGSWEWDVDADLITGSDGLYALYGLSPEAFPATYEGFLGIVHEDDREIVDTAVQEARRVGGEFVFVARVQGETDWVWTRGRGVGQVDDDGHVGWMSGTHQDISETKLAELALQDQVAQNNLMRMIASTANEARTLDDVLIHARHLVLLHDDWVRGRGFAVVDGKVQPLYVTPGDREDDEATPEHTAMELGLAQRCLDEGTIVWDESRLTIAFAVQFAGEAFAILTITSNPPIRRHAMIESMVEQVAVQLARVVERQQYEQELADARDGAMEASRQKSEFLATMSHEIRTPLNGVIGLNELLLRTRLQSDQQRLASGVQAASRALLGLINDVLDFSKIEAGKLELEAVDFEIRSVLDQVTDVLGEAARAKSLDLMVLCDDSVPEVLCGDPTRLAQVITNLGANAVKFTDAGEVLIRVSATRTAGALGQCDLRVEVSDTGIGIRADDFDALFDLFTQADTSTTRVHGGTGLGLAISREIVRALDGEIGVDSTPGEGSVFWFTASFGPPVDHVESSEDTLARTSLAARRVLLVDDSTRHDESVRTQLAWWGMECRSVSSADDAERALEDAIAVGAPFDLVLIDRALAAPRHDGLQLASALRRVPAYDDTVLVVMSATTDLDTSHTRQTGIADVLVKPISHHALRSSLLEQVAGLDLRSSTQAQVDASGTTRQRILVVEDNTVNQMVAVGLLDALGYDADTADDGQAALDLYDPLLHDAVLMDVQMPRLDGYAATRALRASETGSRVPVVAMTAAAVEGERERCLAAGMDDYLTKPVDLDALAATLSRWLSGSRATAPTSPTHFPEPENAVLDLERLDMLRDMSPDDTSYLDRAIGNFVAGAPTMVADIRAAFATDDASSLQQVSHKLAGSALNLGVPGVGQAARAIELVADSGSCDGAGDLLSPLELAVHDGCRELLGYQAAYSTEGARSLAGEG